MSSVGDPCDLGAGIVYEGCELVEAGVPGEDAVGALDIPEPEEAPLASS